MQSFRILPPVSLGAQTTKVNGRTYTAAPGTFLDVPDADAQVHAAAGWTKVAFSGPTGARPTTNASGGPYGVASRGMFFVDTTLSAVIVFDGATWRNPITGAAV